MKSHYFTTKLVKMGRWALLPADCENWMGQETTDYFQKLFGFGKGLLVVCTLTDGYAHMYVPSVLIEKLYAFVHNTNARDPKKLEKLLTVFYPFKILARKVFSEKQNNLKKSSTRELIKLYRKNRNWVHRATVYDQFGIYTEDYWNPVMEKILVKTCGLEKDSPEYFRVLFALTKPEHISTTLEEKRAVLKEGIAVKKELRTIATASRALAKRYGWMPVFTYGEPWDAKHYESELRDVIKKSLKILKQEYGELAEYSARRNREVREIVRRYALSESELQIFVDFGLALDCRNEAEYLVSYAGFYLLPIYKEIARRLSVSVKQLRMLYEDEIIAALKGEIDVEKTLRAKGDIVAWGFDAAMRKRKNFSLKEARALYDYIEKTVKPVQGGDVSKGVCGSPGRVQGVARLVASPAENGKVREGDILVTYATTVDYLSAMKRAAAFVTEVGGLTCHAAVVAREFGVPCIISLKDAMKTIRDGSRVEVNADAGTIRVVDLVKK
ncbi:MAG: PEP-utilizing enzyme [bacterium]|nr:PEP-utilizing enzyme [bacterium]